MLKSRRHQSSSVIENFVRLNQLLLYFDVFALLSKAGELISYKTLGFPQTTVSTDL